LRALEKPFLFFENLWDLLFPHNFRILIAEKNHTVGAVAFFLYHQTIYLTYAGMDKKLLSARHSAIPLLCWSAIKWAEEKGFRNVCFGSTPAHPGNKEEMANYSQKITFGGSYTPQEILFIPFNSLAHALLIVGSTSFNTWLDKKNLLPRKMQNIIEAPMRKTAGIF
jgi:hypothetical protein